MVKTKNRLKKAQARYKKSYDSRLRKQREFINVDDHAYLLVEGENPVEHRDKLTPIAEVLYKVSKVDDNAVVIENTDQSVEKFSRSQVFLAPMPTKEE